MAEGVGIPLSFSLTGGNRNEVRAKGIQPRIAHRGQPHGSGLGKVRWVG